MSACFAINKKIFNSLPGPVGFLFINKGFRPETIIFAARLPMKKRVVPVTSILVP